MAKKTKKTPRKAPKKKPKPKPKPKPKKTYEHHPDHYNRSESYLVDPLPEDLKDAWLKIREFGESLGPQSIYASGRAIVFARKVCYFFVRPKKTYLETVIMLPAARSPQVFKVDTSWAKNKVAHTFKLVHADQVEGALADAIADAYAAAPEGVSKHAP